MNVILGALVRRIKQRAYLDSDEEIARWIEEYCEQSNSHKHSVSGRAIVPHCIWGVDTDCQLINTCPECTPQASEQLPAESEDTGAEAWALIKKIDKLSEYKLNHDEILYDFQEIHRLTTIALNARKSSEGQP